MNKIEQLFDIMKYLHEPKIISKLETEKGISRSTFSHMFSKGEFEFAGVNFPFMRRKIKGKKDEYEFISSADGSEIIDSDDVELKSTVHPVVLPLNLTEVFLLTNHLLEITEGTEDEEMYRQIANKIYPQLSDYAKKAIGNEYGLQEEGIVYYSKEEDSLGYALKLGRIKITFNDNTEIEGKVENSEEGYIIVGKDKNCRYSEIKDQIKFIRTVRNSGI